MSTQIRKLEEYLGVTLIERNAKSISLTPQGREVVAKARRIITQTDDLLSSTRVSREPLAGPLNLGMIPTLAPYILPWLIPRAKSRFPRMRLVVHEDLTQHLIERLRSYQIDAALLALPLDGEEFEEMPLFDEPFWFACSSENPLARLNAVSEVDLIDEPIMLLADGHCLRGQALAACGRSTENDEGHDDFRAASLETICKLVAAGFGSTLLPALAAKPQSAPPSFEIRPLQSANDSRRIGLIWRRGYPKANDLSLLGGLVRDDPPHGTRSVFMEAKLAIAAS
jgi:LysR family hydrogen peroxide-inducible transcriptional activator